MLKRSEIYAEYAAALGRGVDSLSDAEKRQAFINAVLEEHAPPTCELDCNHCPYTACPRYRLVAINVPPEAVSG